MRIAAYTLNGKPGIGIVEDAGTNAVVHPLGNAGDTIRAILEAGADALAGLAAQAGDADPLPMSAVALQAPIPRPGKILAIGLNYKAHVEETGREVSPHQIWFNKQRTCITGPYGIIDKPVASDMVDYEGELVAVIGRQCRHVPAKQAHEVIAGYMVGNDVSVRDWQRRTPTMQMGKSFDTHGPTGPWLVTADEIDDPQALQITTYVNGEVRQRASTGEMIHSIADQIAHLTTAFTLEPGDLIFTGTPQGVGVAMDPPQFLKDGDVVRIEISGVGAIENRVKNEVARTMIA
ncbi:fumarylacetoacetate hydrolase family protein [Pyruvatibacter sp.]|uniref:fumarylacetoacetate hydrolase family protein n=1 Tax=Pyruvatibacter sp. TaxID=1981328 RepID=UPI0032ECD321